MKKIFSTSLILGLLVCSGANAETRTNHSYRNMGFSRAPTVTIGGYMNVKAAQTKQESIFEKNYLPNGNVFTQHPSTLDPIYGTPNKNDGEIVFANDAELHFKINGINDLGFKYGAVIEMEANSTHSSWNYDLNADKAYAFIEGYWGKVEFGNNIGPSQAMKVGAETIARAAGGINGEYLNYINLPMAADKTYYTAYNSGYATYLSMVKLPKFILIPQHVTGHGGGAKGFDDEAAASLAACGADANGDFTDSDGVSCYNQALADIGTHLDLGTTEDATKITYYTPDMYGFQFGVGFTPRSTNIGTSGYNSPATPDSIKEIIDWGVRYRGTLWGEVGLTVSATGQLGKSEDYGYDFSSGNPKIYQGKSELREKINTMEFGASITFHNLTLAGSYGLWGDSLYFKKDHANKYSYGYPDDPSLGMTAIAGNIDKYPDFDDSKYFTAGMAYEFKPFNGSLTYFESDYQGNKLTAFSVGIDYALGKGVMPYLEYTNYKFESVQPKGLEVTSARAAEPIIKDNKGHVILMGLLLNF